jgi:hypothetical protein
MAMPPRATALSCRTGCWYTILNIGGAHQILRSDRRVPAGRHRLGFRMQLGPMVLTPALPTLGRVMVPASRRGSLLIDGEPVGEIVFRAGFTSLISWSGLDIGRDRGSPVSHYVAPFEFSGRLLKVTVTLAPQRELDATAIGNAEMARQ